MSAHPNRGMRTAFTLHLEHTKSPMTNRLAHAA